MKRVYLLVFSLFATIAVALLVWQFSSVLLTFVAAVALGATIRPPADRLIRRGLPRSPATMLMVLLVFTGLLGFLGLTGYALAEELPQALTAYQTRYAALRAEWANGAGWQQSLAGRLPAPEGLEDLIARIRLSDEEATAEEAITAAVDEAVTEAVDEALGEPTEETAQAQPTEVPTGQFVPAGVIPPSEIQGPVTQEATRQRRALGLLQVVVGTTSGLASMLAQFLVLIVLSLYWSLEHEWFERLWISLLPAGLRQKARSTWRAAEMGVGSHIRSEILQSLLAAVLLYIGFRLIGVPNPLLFAWICAVCWIIPLAGWLIALLPVATIALLVGPWVTLGAALIALAVYAFLEFVLEPRLDVRRRAGSIIGLLVAMIMLDALGILGLLIATPLAVAIEILLGQLWTPGEQAEGKEKSDLAQIQQQLAQVRAAMGRVEGELPPRTRSLYERLQELIAQADKTV